MFNIFKSKMIFIPKYDATIGNLSVTLFYALHKAKRENKKMLFIKKKLFFGFLFKKIGYKQLSALYQLESPYLEKPSYLSILIAYAYGFTFSLHVAYRALLYTMNITKEFSYKQFGIGNSDLINVFNDEKFNILNADNTNWHEVYQENFDLSLSEKDNRDCLDNMIRMGIKKGDWYVCLHIRTSFFHGDQPENAFRNSLPENYRKAINHINSLGGKVVRLGDSVDLSINNICIDYPNSKYKSELMDLYLIKNCKFYWGTNSGILDTASLFGVPVLAVNYASFAQTKLFKASDKILLKHIELKNSNKKLSLEEIFNQPFYVNPDINDFYRNLFHENYTIHDNSEEEIYLAVKEMLEDLNEPKKSNDKDKKYSDLLRTAILKWISEEEDHFSKDVDLAYFHYQRTYGKGRVCRFYLEMNLDK